MKLEAEKEREKRICNILLGNVEESDPESNDDTSEKVMEVFEE